LIDSFILSLIVDFCVACIKGLMNSATATTTTQLTAFFRSGCGRGFILVYSGCCGDWVWEEAFEPLPVPGYDGVINRQYNWLQLAARLFQKLNAKNETPTPQFSENNKKPS